MADLNLHGDDEIVAAITKGHQKRAEAALLAASREVAHVAHAPAGAHHRLAIAQAVAREWGVIPTTSERINQVRREHRGGF